MPRLREAVHTFQGANAGGKLTRQLTLHVGQRRAGGRRATPCFAQSGLDIMLFFSGGPSANGGCTGLQMEAIWRPMSLRPVPSLLSASVFCLFCLFCSLAVGGRKSTVFGYRTQGCEVPPIKMFGQFPCFPLADAKSTGFFSNLRRPCWGRGALQKWSDSNHETQTPPPH